MDDDERLAGLKRQVASECKQIVAAMALDSDGVLNDFIKGKSASAADFSRHAGYAHLTALRHLLGAAALADEAKVLDKVASMSGVFQLGDVDEHVLKFTPEQLPEVAKQMHVLRQAGGQNSVWYQNSSRAASQTLSSSTDNVRLVKPILDSITAAVATTSCERIDAAIKACIVIGLLLYC
jgi:hypothetical protein